MKTWITLSIWALMMVGCSSYPEEIANDIYGDYVCTQVIVEAEDASQATVAKANCFCNSAYVGQRVGVEALHHLVWIGFSQEQGGHFTQVKHNRYTSGESVKAAFGNSQLVIDCQQGGYNYRIICQKL